MSPAKPSGGKSVTKEIDLAEQVLLSVSQFKGHLADDSQFVKVTTKQYNKLFKSLQDRLTTELTSLYSREYEGGPESTRGMAILERLQQAEAEMDAVKELVFCLEGTPPRSGEQFQTALQRVRDNRVNVAAVADELVAGKFLADAFAAKKWEMFGKYINRNDAEFNFAKFTMPKAKEIIQDNIVKAITEFCKSDKPAEVMEPLHGLVASVVTSASKEHFPDVHDDIGRLQLQLDASDDMSDDKLKRTDGARDTLSRNRQGLLFKSLTMLTSGKHIMANAARVSDSMAKMRTFDRELASLQSCCEVLPAASSLHKDQEASLDIPDANQWILLHTKLASIRANSPAKLLASSLASLDTFHARQKKLADMLLDKSSSVWAELTGPVVDIILAKFDEVEQSKLKPDAAIKLVQEQLDTLQPELLLKNCDLDATFPPDVSQPLKGMVVNFTEVLATIKAAVPLLVPAVAGTLPPLASQAMVNLAVILDKKHEKCVANVFGKPGLKLHDLISPLVLSCVAVNMQTSAVSMASFVRQLSTDPADFDKIFSGEFIGPGDPAVIQEVATKCEALFRNYKCMVAADYMIEVKCSGPDDDEAEAMKASFIVTAVAPSIFSLAQSVCSLKRFETNGGKVADFLGMVLPMFNRWQRALTFVDEVLLSETWRALVSAALERSLAAIKGLVDNSISEWAAHTNKGNGREVAQASEALQELFSVADSFTSEHTDKAMVILEMRAVPILYEMFKLIDHTRVSLDALKEMLGKVQVVHTTSCVSKPIAALVEALDVALTGDGEEDRKRAGRLIGNLTVVQAIYRPLKEGETRAGLASKCRKSMKKKRYITADPHLDLFMEGLVNNTNLADKSLVDQMKKMRSASAAPGEKVATAVDEPVVQAIGAT